MASQVSRRPQEEQLILDRGTTCKINHPAEATCPCVAAALAPSQHHTWKTRGDQDYVGKEREKKEVHRMVKVTFVEINGAVTAVASSADWAGSGKPLGNKAVQAPSAGLLQSSSSLVPQKVFLHSVFGHHHLQLFWQGTQCPCFLA